MSDFIPQSPRLQRRLEALRQKKELIENQTETKIFFERLRSIAHADLKRQRIGEEAEFNFMDAYSLIPSFELTEIESGYTYKNIYTKMNITPQYKLSNLERNSEDWFYSHIESRLLAGTALLFLPEHYYGWFKITATEQGWKNIWSDLKNETLILKQSKHAAEVLMFFANERHYELTVSKTKDYVPITMKL